MRDSFEIGAGFGMKNRKSYVTNVDQRLGEIAQLYLNSGGMRDRYIEPSSFIQLSECYLH